jgi:hypothetical protein
MKAGVVGVALAIAGCRSPAGSDVICTAIALPGLAVAVRDSANGAPTGPGAVVTAREGAYADTARGGGPDGRFFLATERTGTYTVRVEQPGYRPWERSGVRVGADECHVRTVELTALLQR